MPCLGAVDDRKYRESGHILLKKGLEVERGVLSKGQINILFVWVDEDLPTFGVGVEAVLVPLHPRRFGAAIRELELRLVQADFWRAEVILLEKRPEARSTAEASAKKAGGTGRARTGDLEFRKLSLYPTELRPRGA